jgi:hypothetical protein
MLARQRRRVAPDEETLFFDNMRKRSGATVTSVCLRGQTFSAGWRMTGMERGGYLPALDGGHDRRGGVVGRQWSGEEEEMRWETATGLII